MISEPSAIVPSPHPPRSIDESNAATQLRSQLKNCRFRATEGSVMRVRVLLQGLGMMVVTLAFVACGDSVDQRPRSEANEQASSAPGVGANDQELSPGP